MIHDKDKILLRAKDIGLLLSIFTLIGFMFGPAKKLFQIEQTLDDVKILKGQVVDNKTKIAVINAQYADIQKQLEQINWQLRSMNRRHWRGDGSEQN